jgi:GT2 family glycosyltransferase
MLSIIIVNYKSEKNLEKCIASVREKLLSADYEIIVVNNDTGLKSLPLENINWINAGGNIGFGTACNLGARSAQGELICFLNPDTEIISENIGELASKLKNSGSLAVAGPKLLNENGKTQWWCAGKEFSLWRLIKNNVGLIESRKIWESRKEILADWVSGAAFFVKKEIFEKTGGFDELFFLYFEDEDLCRRIRALGYGILYCPEFTVLHKGGKSRDNFLKQKMHFFRSMLAYIRKRKKA